MGIEVTLSSLRNVGSVEIWMLYATKNMAMLQLIKMVKTKINF